MIALGAFSVGVLWPDAGGTAGDFSLVWAIIGVVALPSIGWLWGRRSPSNRANATSSMDRQAHRSRAWGLISAGAMLGYSGGALLMSHSWALLVTGSALMFMGGFGLSRGRRVFGWERPSELRTSADDDWWRF